MLALKHLGSGKVREIYEIDPARLLMVATDRISAYDHVLTPDIPDKGRVLTGLTLYWLGLLGTPDHLIAAGPPELDAIPADARAALAGRSMVVHRADVVPMECVVRGYLYGSSWREYRTGGGPTTEHLPPGLRMGDRLDEPVFTPATKAVEGHDENLTEAGARELVGAALYEELADRSIELYRKAAEHAAGRGIILADTKFEFGLRDGEVILIDEVLTPDSSRYWPAEDWRPGHPVPSFDKQYVRDWLDSTDWDHESTPPPLPPGVVEGTRARYVEAYERLTGRAFADYLRGAGAV